MKNVQRDISLLTFEDCGTDIAPRQVRQRLIPAGKAIPYNIQKKTPRDVVLKNYYPFQHLFKNKMTPTAVSTNT